MNRQQIIVVIAIINKISKEIGTMISTGDYSEAVKIIPEIKKMKRYDTEIEKFFKVSSCEPFIRDIDHICSTDKLWEVIMSGKINDLEILALLKDFAMTVDKLKSYSATYKRVSKEAKFIYLVDELSNDKALEAMQRAVDAGLLTSTYQLDGCLSRLQVRVLAFALAKVIGLPRKGQYSIFMHQWHWDENDRLSWIHMPEGEHDDINLIKKVFPEVDYTLLIRPNPTAFFNIDCDDEKILSLFMSLLSHGYIDCSTTYENFRKVFGRGNLDERKPVNWIKPQRALSYFIYLTFDDKVFNIWQKTKNCFVLNGKIPNLGSLRSGLKKIEREGLDNSYDPVLYGISRLFAQSI